MNKTYIQYEVIVRPEDDIDAYVIEQLSNNIGCNLAYDENDNCYHFYTKKWDDLKQCIGVFVSCVKDVVVITSLAECKPDVKYYDNLPYDVI